MGQYVTRGGKKYYKADDGKLYSNFESAYAAQSPTIFEQALGMQQSAIKPFGTQISNVLGGIGSGITSGFNQLARSLEAATISPEEAWLREGQRLAQEESRKKREIERNAPPAPNLPPPGHSPTTIVQSADDQYRQLLSQYGALQKAKKFEEADTLGMEIWKQKYGKTAMGQPKGVVGTYNPLLAKTFEGENIPSQVQAFTNPQGLNEQASFSIAANAVPAPWHTQGAAVSAPYQEAAAKAEEKTNPMNLVSQQGFDPDTLSRVSDFLLKFQK